MPNGESKSKKPDSPAADAGTASEVGKLLEGPLSLIPNPKDLVEAIIELVDYIISKLPEFSVTDQPLKPCTPVKVEIPEGKWTLVIDDNVTDVDDEKVGRDVTIGTSDKVDTEKSTDSGNLKKAVTGPATIWVHVKTDTPRIPKSDKNLLPARAKLYKRS